MLCPRCHRNYPDSETRCAYDQAELTDAPRIEFARSGKTRHIGTTLGNRFEIRGFMGQGGSSRVYLAKDTETNEPVALKILEPPWAHDRVARERFLQEARAASAIDHPGIVKIHFVGQRTDGTPYIAMEYLFGETLDAYLVRQKVIEFDVGLPVLREVAVALEAAHCEGVIHRDVKPDNIFLLGEPGEPYAVKVVDFGFAKLRDSTITAAGTAIGTVGFMAPEQCVADSVDERTDIYGLGVVAYRMFTGKLPFGEGPTEEVLGRHLVSDRPRAIDIKPALDPFLSAIIEKCMRRDPANRYAHMGAFVADLDAITEGRAPPHASAAPPEVDEYEPQGPFSRLVARALYRKIGASVPDRWA